METITISKEEYTALKNIASCWAILRLDLMENIAPIEAAFEKLKELRGLKTKQKEPD